MGIQDWSELSDNKPRTVCGPLAELRNTQIKNKVWCLVVIVRRDGGVHYRAYSSHMSPQQHADELARISAEVKALQYMRDVVRTLDKGKKSAFIVDMENRLKEAERCTGELPAPVRKAAEECWRKEMEVNERVMSIFEEVFYCSHAEHQFIREWLALPTEQIEAVKEVGIYTKTSPCAFIKGEDDSKYSKPESCRLSHGGVLVLPAGCLNKIELLAKTYPHIMWDSYFDNVHGTAQAQNQGRDMMRQARAAHGNLNFWLMGAQLGRTCGFAASVDPSFHKDNKGWYKDKKQKGHKPQK